MRLLVSGAFALPLVFVDWDPAAGPGSPDNANRVNWLIQLVSPACLCFLPYICRARFVDNMITRVM